MRVLGQITKMITALHKNKDNNNIKMRKITNCIRDKNASERLRGRWPQRRPLVCKLGHASHGLQHSRMYLQSAAADTVQVKRGKEMEDRRKGLWSPHRPL